MLTRKQYEEIKYIGERYCEGFLDARMTSGARDMLKCLLQVLEDNYVRKNVENKNNDYVVYHSIHGSILVPAKKEIINTKKMCFAEYEREIENRLSRGHMSCMRSAAEVAYKEQKKNETMTLDEAIKHCEERSDCSECGQEHKQLAEWLKELKHRRQIISSDCVSIEKDKDENYKYANDIERMLNRIEDLETKVRHLYDVIF